MKMRWCITYTMPYDTNNMVKHWQILTNLSSPGGSTWCPARDMFWHKKVRFRPRDSSLRLTSLNYVHIMIIGRLTSYTIPLEPSNRAKTMVAGAYFSGFDDWSGASMRGNLGMTGLYSAVTQSSKALIYTIIVSKWKRGASSPIQCLLVSKTW